MTENDQSHEDDSTEETGHVPAKQSGNKEVILILSDEVILLPDAAMDLMDKPFIVRAESWPKLFTRENDKNSQDSQDEGNDEDIKSDNSSEK